MSDENPGAFKPGHRPWSTGITYTIVPRVSPRPERMKKCANCQQWWAITSYQRCAANPDGHRHQCKACRQERRSQLRRGAPRVKPWGLKKCGP